MPERPAVPYSPQLRRVMDTLKLEADPARSWSSEPLEYLLILIRCRHAAQVLADLADSHRQYRDYHRWTKKLEWYDQRISEERATLARGLSR